MTSPPDLVKAKEAKEVVIAIMRFNAMQRVIDAARHQNNMWHSPLVMQALHQLDTLTKAGER